MYTPHLFVSLFTEGHSGCFHILAIVKNASVSMEVHKSFWINVFVSLAKYPEVELLDCMIVVSLIFLSNFPVVFRCSVQLRPTLCDLMDCSPLSITNSRNLLKLMSIESVMPSSYLTLCRPLLLLPSIFPSIRVFSNESALCIRWPSVGVSVSASELPMNIQDWFPLGWTGWISL